MSVKILLLSFFTLCLTTIGHANAKDMSASLAIIYGGVDETGTKALFLSDESGKRRVKIISATLSDGYPAVSPNGKQVAFYGKYDKYKTWSIHTVDADGNNLRRLTHVQHVWDSSPTWSPDGKTIAFAREYRAEDGEMQEEIWLMNADGSNKRKIKALKGRSPEFMPDGRLLFQTKSGPSQISIANIDGSNVIQLTNDDSNNMSPKISPDGSRIAYLSNRDGNQEVYIMDLDGSNQHRITDNSITEWDPAWSVDGNKVFFSSQNVHGFYDINRANIDGSSIERVVINGSQSGSLSNVDRSALEKLVKIK
ncbi:MAG: DUF5050 domain-containing protein [Alteromonadaceae bacterium]|nr:DUF5050 domain-containing protein [Alteromonadaceae bacterium]